MGGPAPWAALFRTPRFRSILFAKENYMSRSVAFVAAVAALLLTAAPTFAQHDASWKGLGQKGPSHQGFSRRIQHAADYSRDLHAYVHPPGKPAAAPVKD